MLQGELYAMCALAALVVHELFLGRGHPEARVLVAGARRFRSRTPSVASVRSVSIRNTDPPSPISAGIS